MSILPSDSIYFWELVVDISSLMSVALTMLIATFPFVDRQMRLGLRLLKLKGGNSKVGKAPKSLEIITALFAVIVWYSAPKLETLKDRREARIRAELSVKVAQANERAAKANLLAQRVQQDNLMIKENLAPRRITKVQWQILVTELSKKKNKYDISVMADQESAQYAHAIRGIFTEAGWKIGSEGFAMAERLTGLVIYRTNDPAAKLMIRAFRMAHISFTVITPPYKPDRVTLLVGSKSSIN